MSVTIRRLDDQISVAPQITEADIPRLAAQGFKVLINNRPDGEEPGQLTAERARVLAEANGLTYVHLPVTLQTLPQAADAFARVLAESAGPVLAHCRSGTRSCLLWAYAGAATTARPVDEIIRSAREAGYEITDHRPALEILRQHAR